MHELAITQNIVEICKNHASGRRILSIRVEIGHLSGVVPEAVEFCFGACSRETLLEGARLVIERVPGRARCRDCSAEQDVASFYEPCAACGGSGMELLSGTELRVREMEVE
jgi:hydrogenase nickel incorporation protein HypA/HybF